MIKIIIIFILNAYKMKKDVIIFIFLILVSCGKQETTNTQKIVNNTLANKTNIVSNHSNQEIQEISQAHSLFNNKDYSSAKVSYENLLKEGVSDADIINNLFVCYVSTMEYQKAANIIIMFIQSIGPREEFIGSYISQGNLSNDIITIHNELELDGYKNQNLIVEYAKHLYTAGDYYYELDQQKYYFAIMFHYLSAYLALEEAQKLDDTNSEIYYYKGRLIMDIGSPYKYSIDELKKAIELKNDDFNYYYRLGNAYMHSEEYDLAKDNFLKGINLNNKYEKLYLNLGNVYFALGSKNKGYEAYNNGLKVCSQMCDGFYNNIGLQLFDEGKYSQAKTNFEKAIELNPKNTTAQSYINKINTSLNQ